jgi:hypothetical protein
MRRALSVILITFVCGCKSADPPLCVHDPELMPESWRPAGNVHESLNQSAWTAAESEDAAHAVREGLKELTEFFASRPEAIKTLGSDAVESLLDAGYSASNMPDVQSAARTEARRVLLQLTAPLVKREPGSVRCDEFRDLLSLTIYAHQLQAEGERAMAALTNAGIHACGSLDKAMSSETGAWNRVMWSIEITGAQTVPGLVLPPEVHTFPQSVWRSLQDYPLTGARAYPEAASNETFYQTAYLATHIAYIPTGYGRYAIHIEDSPRLFRFLRENFYPVLELGELDLTAEFSDLFRQYGCTEANDLQLRDATRYLLRLFHAAGDHWMAHRESYEPTAISDYDLVHKPWTGVGGVRTRVLETPEPGNYGGVVRQWLLNTR